MIKIGIGGDIVPTESNYEYFLNKNLSELIGDELYNKLKSLDYSIFNLEAPITSSEKKIQKCGPNLKIPINVAQGLDQFKPVFFNLANNHIKDYGVQGIESTIDFLKKNKINFAGVGSNLNDLEKNFIFEEKGVKVGIYCCSEHEFSIANDTSAGANPFDPLVSFDEVNKLSEETDFLIVLYHGGKEQYRFPTPNMQKIFRKFAEKGADLVIGQHSHCIGCQEIYKNSTLIYGQGNFIFDATENDYWQTSLFLELEIEKNSNKIKYIPIVKKKNKIRIAEKEQEREIINDFYQRSELILDEKYVKEKFNELCSQATLPYIKVLSGNKNFFQKAFIKIFQPNINFFYRNEKKLACINFLECETHHEMLLNILKRDI